MAWKSAPRHRCQARCFCISGSPQICLCSYLLYCIYLETVLFGLKRSSLSRDASHVVVFVMPATHTASYAHVVYGSVELA